MLINNIICSVYWFMSSSIFLSKSIAGTRVPHSHRRTTEHLCAYRFISQHILRIFIENWNFDCRVIIIITCGRVWNSNGSNYTGDNFLPTSHCSVMPCDTTYINMGGCKYFRIISFVVVVDWMVMIFLLLLCIRHTSDVNVTQLRHRSVYSLIYRFQYNK